MIKYSYTSFLTVFFLALPPITAPSVPKSAAPTIAPPVLETYCCCISTSFFIHISIILAFSSSKFIFPNEKINLSFSDLILHTTSSAIGKPFICFILQVFRFSSCFFIFSSLFCLSFSVGLKSNIVKIVISIPKKINTTNSFEYSSLNAITKYVIANIVVNTPKIRFNILIIKLKQAI